MHKTHRRFRGYDYARGGSMFVTTCLEHRRPLFGRVDHERVVLSESGEIVKRELLAAVARFVGFITLRTWTVMPDHAHIRFTWPAGHAEAVKKIGAFVGRFKQMSHYHIAGRAPGIWEKGYTYLSTFFSPGERMVFKALAELENVPMIRLVPTFMELAYRPHGPEPQLFAQKRLLVLSRMADPEEPPRRGELVGLNFIAAAIARASEGGRAVYVAPPQGGRNQVVYGEHPVALQRSNNLVAASLWGCNMPPSRGYNTEGGKPCSR